MGRRGERRKRKREGGGGEGKGRGKERGGEGTYMFGKDRAVKKEEERYEMGGRNISEETERMWSSP